jgi:hypothetical protein
MKKNVKCFGCRLGNWAHPEQFNVNMFATVSVFDYMLLKPKQSSKKEDVYNYDYAEIMLLTVVKNFLSCFL